MICVGITGSYASGKTFVLNYLVKLGFITFSADEYIKNLYQQPKIQNMVIDILDLKNFDKKIIAELIYNDDAARNKLQNFIHPFVVNGLTEFKLENNNYDITFAEVPLLFEAKFDKYFDIHVTTFCSEETRLKRAISREAFTLDSYNKIAIIQLSQQVKMEKANFVINTDVNLLDLYSQITQLIQKLMCHNN
jgi:dephospho-CoA kinase